MHGHSPTTLQLTLMGAKGPLSMQVPYLSLNSTGEQTQVSQIKALLSHICWATSPTHSVFMQVYISTGKQTGDDIKGNRYFLTQSNNTEWKVVRKGILTSFGPPSLPFHLLYHVLTVQLTRYPVFPCCVPPPLKWKAKKRRESQRDNTKWWHRSWKTQVPFS